MARLVKAMVGNTDKMGPKKKQKKNTSSWSSSWVKFLVKGFELPKKLDHQRISLAKNVAMLATMIFFFIHA